MEIVELRADPGVRLVQGHVIEASPLEQDPPVCRIELLHDPADDRAVLRAAERGQIGLGVLPRRDERGVAVGEQELVQVGRMAPTRGDAFHDPVGGVEYHVRPVAQAVLGLSLHQVSTGFPWYRAVRKFSATTGFVGWK